MNPTRVKTWREGFFRYFTCTCGAYQSVNENMPWCSCCFVEYTVSKSGKSVLIDPEKKTPQYAWAKGVGRAGGISFGTPTED